MLGKQWINRYARNSGGCAAEKSRDRQRKLDELEEWYFRFVIESLPLILQLGLLLLGCALFISLWKVSRTVSLVILTFTLLGVALYILFTLLAMFCHSCPYQTPPSILARAATKSNLKSFKASFIGFWSRLAGKFVQTLVQLFSGIRSGLETLCRIACSPQDPEGGQLTHQEPADWGFGAIPDSDIFKRGGDARCISWILGSATDGDVIYCTARFGVDTILYPDIADIISPGILKDHLLACLPDGRVPPDKLEHVNVIGLALASVLSIQLCINPTVLLNLSRVIRAYTDWISTSSKPKFLTGIAILGVVSQSPEELRGESFQIISKIPGDTPTNHKLCLSRTILQTIWRWRQDPNQTAAFINLEALGLFCKGLMENGDHIIPALKTNCFLIMTISLGEQFGKVRTLFTPNDNALRVALTLFHERLKTSIRSNGADEDTLTLVLSALVHLDPFGVLETDEWGFLWVTEILNSGRRGDERHRMASQVLQLLEYYYRAKGHAEGPLTSARAIIYILSAAPTSIHFNATIPPPLILALSPTHRLQLRRLALEFILESIPHWVLFDDPNTDLEGLLQAVGDPFHLTPEPPLHNGQPANVSHYNPMKIVVALIGSASSDRWRNHLCHPNFVSCEKSALTDAGRATLKQTLDETSHVWPEFLCTPQKVTATARRLEQLQCLETARVVGGWVDPRITS